MPGLPSLWPKWGVEDGAAGTRAIPLCLSIVFDDRTTSLAKTLTRIKQNMTVRLSRRHLLGGVTSAAALAAFGEGLPLRSHAQSAGTSAAEMTPGAAGGATGVRYGAAQPFSFDVLRQLAEALAGKPHVPGRSEHGALIDRIDYDPYQQIRYRPDDTLALGETPVQLFHLGKFFQDPTRIHVVTGGEAREVIYDTQLFDMPDGHPARQLPENAGFAGFRVMSPDLKTDWISYLGASYFRTSGPFDQYGLSARGLAIDTGLPTPEEFPRFSRLWLEAGHGGQQFVVYALLDSPSVAGAYRMETRRKTNDKGVHKIVQDISLEIFARKDIARLGIAPFSSMYWYGEGNRRQGPDWRPEVHDSDGLSIVTGSGERLWRPLGNPPRVMTNSFVDRDIKGFGLLQRDRNFENYLDDGVFYERRASVWVEPLEGWGEGAVQLLEIPTDDEIHDNIAAYWVPARTMKAGDKGSWSYRLTWGDDAPDPGELGRTIATFTGFGGRPGQKRPKGVRKYVIDFDGSIFKGLGREDGVSLVVTASRGSVSNESTYPVVGQPHRWRAMFDIAADGPDPVDLRAYLKRNNSALSETWLAQYFPEA